jgi:carbamoyl-phosphate synthase small subunit
MTQTKAADPAGTWAEPKPTALLVLADGTVLEGFGLGATGHAVGEVCFNTAMTGYQEVLTDPSYAGQIVTMTYPLIGNYGVNNEDDESRKVFLSGYIVREASEIVSNWRSNHLTLDAYLKKNNIVGIQDLDTRAITKHIRTAGAMIAVISSEDLPDDELVAKAKAAPHMEGRDLVGDVLDKPYIWQEQGSFKVVVYDCGIKYNILRQLAEANCRVEVVPATTSSEDILARKPDGVLLGNGPGDPAAVSYAIKTVKGLLGKVPLFGICLGHQMLGLALDGKTYKLKFGHHGGNHPVKDIATGKVMITVQNHGFCVDIDSLGGDKNVEITHLNLNDGTCEGINHKHIPAFSVQFHPEAGPGPHDARLLFARFCNLMKEHKN